VYGVSHDVGTSKKLKLVLLRFIRFWIFNEISAKPLKYRVIFIIGDNNLHNFSTLFWQKLYIFLSDLLSIIRSLKYSL